MAEARGGRRPNVRSFARRMRLRPEQNPVKISYRCPRCGGPIMSIAAGAPPAPASGGGARSKPPGYEPTR